MSYYHVTDKEYCIGEVVDATTFDSTEYNQRTIKHGMGSVDDILDNSRPNGLPSRKNCLFAFDNIGMCMHFIGNRYSGKELYYEVKLLDPVRCPMKLTKVLNEKKYTVAQEVVINEYWQPSDKNDWKYIEYLASSMKIIAKVEGNDKMAFMMSGSKNDADERLATNLFLK